MPKIQARTTIRQVAEACQVSPMTVSAVLNNKPGQVSPETRERVLEAVRATGYRLTPAHRQPETHRTAILGVISGVSGHSLMRPGYYNSILDGILTAADRLGHHILLLTNREFYADVHRSIRTYCDGRCDGVLVVAPPSGSQLVAALHERGLPFVQIGDTGEDTSVPCADVDNEAEVRRMVEYLIEMGHRRIAFLGDPSHSPSDPYMPRSARQRKLGYEKALTAQGIPLDLITEVSVGASDQLAYQKTLQLLRLPPAERPTAIFCWHDAAAVPTLRAIQDLGLRCPQDVSVAGFDDDPNTAGLNPPLTTVRQPYTQISEAAVKILTALIQKRTDIPLRQILPAELVLRGSVAPPWSTPDETMAEGVARHGEVFFG